MRYSELLEYTKYSDDGHRYDYVNSPIHNDVNDILRKRDDPDRGPHQNKELNMMLAGVKPAALISIAEYDLLWEPYVKSGVFIAREYVNMHNHINYVVGLPGEEKRIDRIINLLTAGANEMITNPNPKSSDLYHIRLGRLLGYTKEQVRKFITD